MSKGCIPNPMGIGTGYEFPGFSTQNVLGWGYQDFAAGAISGTAVTITDNENGAGFIYNALKIINSTAVIVRKTDTDSFPYSGTTKLFSTRIKVNAHTVDAITLNAIPDVSWGDLRVYFAYTYDRIPNTYTLAPKFIRDTHIVEVDELFINEEEFALFKKQSIGHAATGLLKGGEITQSIDPTKVDYTEGIAVFVDNTDPANPVCTYVPFVAGTTVSVTLGPDRVVLWLQINGSIILRDYEEDHIQLERQRTEVKLGTLLLLGTNEVQEIEDVSTSVSLNVGNTFADLFAAIGPRNLGGGNVYGPSSLPAPSLAIKKTAGEIVWPGVSLKTNPLLPNILFSPLGDEEDFIYTWRDGTGGWKTIFSAPKPFISLLIPSLYDDGTGGGGQPNGTVGPSQYTIKRVFTTFTTTVIQFGQNVYTTKAQALDAINSEVWERSPELEEALFRASIIIRGGATDATVLSQVEFFEVLPAFSGAGSSAVTSLQQAYDNSVTPEIIINPIAGALTIRDALIPTGLNILEVENYAGTERYFGVSVTETLINTNNVNHDFRVKSLTDNYNLFSDASTDRIGIGTATPLAKLDVNGDVLILDDLTVGLNNLLVDTLNDRVGIGTATPIHDFHIVASGNNISILGISGASSDASSIDLTPVNNSASGTLQAVRLVPNLQPNVATTNVYNFNTNANMSTTAFNVTNFYSIFARASILASYSGNIVNAIGINSSGVSHTGSGTITNGFGMRVTNFGGATNNYAFYSGMNSGTDKWGFYAGGTAQNFFGGATTIKQPSASGARPVLTLDQADISEEMIHFTSTIGVGNAIEAVGAKTLTVTHFIKSTIAGVGVRYLPAGTIP